MRSSLRLIAAYLRANLQGALEYRASFFAEVLAMFASDTMWLIFWIAFFDRFPAVPGWGRDEIVALWAVVAASVGLATAVFGNLVRLAGLIDRGELDFFLTLPRPVLLHALISKTSFTAWGDLLFGVGVFLVLADPSALELLLFAVLAVSSAGILIGFGTLISSLAFWLRGAEGAVQQGIFILISFSTYPTAIFRGAIKLMLFTLIPAGFIAYVPVEVLREPRLSWLAVHVVVSLLFVSAGAFAFGRGLRRYESGNLFVARL
jgi:ABC-2 type transport system permease protein